MKELIAQVKKNYSVAVLDEGVAEHDETRELGAVLKLNQAGRRYLINDAGSIAKGVFVKNKVVEELTLALHFNHIGDTELQP
jgi:hypothetical protein